MKLRLDFICIISILGMAYAGDSLYMPEVKVETIENTTDRIATVAVVPAGSMIMPAIRDQYYLMPHETLNQPIILKKDIQGRFESIKVIISNNTELMPGQTIPQTALEYTPSGLNNTEHIEIRPDKIVQIYKPVQHIPGVQSTALQQPALQNIYTPTAYVLDQPSEISSQKTYVKNIIINATKGRSWSIGFVDEKNNKIAGPFKQNDAEKIIPINMVFDLNKTWVSVKDYNPSYTPMATNFPAYAPDFPQRYGQRHSLVQFAQLPAQPSVNIIIEDYLNDFRIRFE